MKFIQRCTLLFFLVKESTAQTWGYQPNAATCTLEPTAIHDDCVSNDLAPISFRVFSAATMADVCPSFKPSDCNYGLAVENGNTIPNWEFRGTIENCGGSTRPTAGLQSLTGVVPTPKLIQYCESNGYGTPPSIEIFPQVFCHDSSNPLYPDGVLGGSCGEFAEEFPLGDFFLVCGYQYKVTAGSIMYWSTASAQDTCNKFQQCRDLSPKCSGLANDYIIELPCGDTDWCTNEPIDPMPAPTSAATPAPTPAATPAESPVASPTDAPLPFGCRRRLQDLELELKWNIAEPMFDYESLKFTLDFEISDFIASTTQVQSTLFLDDCTGTYNGNALADVVGTAFTSIDGDGKQNIAVEIDIDPTKISSETDIYSEIDGIGVLTADVDFCVRVGLHTPAAAGEDEINYLETIIRFDVDLSDGFNITSVSVEPRDKCALAAEDQFLVEGYFCQDGFEYDATLGQAAPINQGDLVKICVRPQQRGLDSFVRMRRIADFTFTKNALSVISQPAIENGLPASNGLTEVYCVQGNAICYFETILYASFFTETATISGSGVADLQFGGEESQSSVSPRTAIGKRRTLRAEDKERSHRSLQSVEQDSAAVVAFDLNVDVQESIRSFGDLDSAATTTWITRFLLTAASTLLGFVLLLA